MNKSIPKDLYISVELAMERLLEQTLPPDTWEDVPLFQAAGRILARDYYAEMDQPPFNRSPLDGFALNHTDVAAASKNHPVSLTIDQSIYAGDTPVRDCLPMYAARIMTGAPLPPGADCVIRQEDVEEENGKIILRQTLKQHENFCFQGEDIPIGSRLLQRGDQLTPARLGLLATQGLTLVQVYQKPEICVYSTGDELLSAGVPWQPGKIYDSNSLTLAIRAVELGADIADSGHLPDDPEQLAASLTAACQNHRLVVTTGGVSVGSRDYLRQVCDSIGGELLFHGIKAKPGSPAVAYRKDQALILCLSGNPFAAFATFELLAVPILKKLRGLSDPLPQRLEAILKDDFKKTSPNRRFVQAQISHGYVSLSALTECNCMLDIPAGSDSLITGSKVQVMML